MLVLYIQNINLVLFFTSYSIIKACCQWKEQDRPSLSEVRHKLQSGEKSANDSSILRVPEPINIEQYLKEAGYGESNNYTVFWTPDGSTSKTSKLYENPVLFVVYTYTSSVS